MTAEDEVAARLAALVRESVEEDVRDVAAPPDLAAQVLAGRRRRRPPRGLTVSFAVLATAAAAVTVPVVLRVPAAEPRPAPSEFALEAVDLRSVPGNLPDGMRVVDAGPEVAEIEQNEADGWKRRIWKVYDAESRRAVQITVIQGMSLQTYGDGLLSRGTGSGSTRWAGCGFSVVTKRTARAVCEQQAGLLVDVIGVGLTRARAVEMAAQLEVVQ
ncbi:hypothetical protein GCM10022221_77110 [Actinocorallia aurea]